MLAQCGTVDGKGQPPLTWLPYRPADPVACYRVRLPVARPPAMGPHAAKFGEEERWHAHEAFLALGSTLGAEQACGLVRRLDKKAPPDADLARLFVEVR